MNDKSRYQIVSCFQCAGAYYCYGTKHPELAREEARLNASKCISYRKGSPNETVAVNGFKYGLSRKNAEKLVLSNQARWISHKTIEIVGELPVNLYRRLTKDNNNS